MKATLVAASLLATIIWAAPSSTVLPSKWQRIGSSPSRYILRLEGVTGTLRTPKLLAPAGASVLVTASGGSLSGNRVTWSTMAPWTPGPSAAASASCFGLIRPYEAGASLPTTGSFALSGARWFDMDATFPSGAYGMDTMAVSGFAVGGAAVWSSNGGPFSLEVTPLWSIESPSPSVQVSQSETYTVELIASWQ